MKHQGIIIAVVVVSALLALRLVTQPSRQRQELSAIPGGVAYSEGTSQAPQRFAEALALLEKGQVAEAAEVYRKIISLEPNNALGHIGLGSCLLLQEDLEQAHEQYNAAMQLDSRSSQAAIGLASVAHRRGQFSAAIENYQRALTLDDNLADAHLGLALSHDELDHSQQALTHYQRFLQLAPTSRNAGEVQARIAKLTESLPAKP